MDWKIEKYAFQQPIKFQQKITLRTIMNWMAFHCNMHVEIVQVKQCSEFKKLIYMFTNTPSVPCMHYQMTGKFPATLIFYFFFNCFWNWSEIVCSVSIVPYSLFSRRAAVPSRGPQVRERIHTTETTHTLHSVIHKDWPIFYVLEPIPIICILVWT